VTYAGGGAGGSGITNPGGLATAGGGNASNYQGDAGLANSGGGGGGSGASSDVSLQQRGGTGGSGVVIIRYLASFAPARLTTGSPLTYKTGFYRVYVFNASGTITF